MSVSFFPDAGCDIKKDCDANAACYLDEISMTHYCRCKDGFSGNGHTWCRFYEPPFRRELILLHMYIHTYMRMKHQPKTIHNTFIYLYISKATPLSMYTLVGFDPRTYKRNLNIRRQYHLTSPLRHRQRFTWQLSMSFLDQRALKCP
jgi:hypothetical protein